MELRAVRKRKPSARIGVLLSRYDDPDVDPFYDPDFDPESPGELEEIIARPRDSFVDLAKSDLKKLFEQESESVFYQRQLQVMFEQKYFHWITVRALHELVQEGSIAPEILPLPGSGTATGNIVFYWSISYRYWRRDADEIVKLVSQFSESAFTYALGAHGEMMFDAALPTVGFMPTGWKVRSHGGRVPVRTAWDEKAV